MVGGGGWLSQHMVGWERCWPSSLQKGDVLLSLGVFLSLLEHVALEGGSKVTRGGEGLLQAQALRVSRSRSHCGFLCDFWRRQCGGQGEALREKADLEMSFVLDLEGSRFVLPCGPDQGKGFSSQPRDCSGRSNPCDPQSRGAL